MNDRSLQGAAKNQEYEYEYTYAKFTNVGPELKYPMAASVSFEDNSLTKGLWTKDVVSTLLRIRANQVMYDIAINDNRCSTLKFVFDIRFLTFINNPKNSEFIGNIYNLLRRIFKSISKKEPPTEGEPNPSNGLVKAIVEKNITEKVKTIQKQELRHKKASSSLSFQSYKDLFQIIYLPSVADRAQSDKSFAAQRIAGVNPLVIERLTEIPAKFPITETQYQSVIGTSDFLQQALEQKRLYIADYQILAEIQPGTIATEEGLVQKYIYQPIALFAVEPGNCPNRRLVPVAIQCYQKPASDNPIFVVPPIASTISERWAWQMAKSIVQIADANYHEFISHLGGTHLLMEPIAISTYRQLPKEHPLGALLRPHLEGTLFINDSAVKGLVNLGGTVDKVAAGTLESSLLLSVKGAKGFPFSFNESSLPMTLKSRGVDDPDCLPDYPYRDDALPIWAAIHEWVDSYLRLFYPDDLAVQTDRSIQNWIAELTDPNGGQMTGIGEQNDNTSKPEIKTLEYLIEAVTTIVFTASAQHAAVNFPQSSFMTYMPNMPLAGYCPAPQTTKGISKADYFELLPSLNQAETQMNMTYLLGSIYYTRLGNYGYKYFVDKRVTAPLEKFQQQLRTIELEINARNEVRATHYDVLLPSKIPQSINI